MITLREFLEEAPRKVISRIFRKQYPNSGLVKGSRAIESMHAWAADGDRVRRVFAQLGNTERKIVTLVYLSENRGLSEAEFYCAFPDLKAEELSRMIHGLAREFLIYFRKNEKFTFHGFKDLMDVVIDFSSFGTTEPVPEGEWVSYRHFLSSHFIHFLSRVRLGRINITRKGEIHRRDIQALKEQFSFGKGVSSAVGKREIWMFYHFLIQEDCLLEHDTILRLSQNGIDLTNMNTVNVEHKLFKWWHKNRWCGAAAGLEKLARAFCRGIEIERLADLIWFYSGPLAGTIGREKTYLDYAEGLTWEQLPGVIQELWLFGLVAFFIRKGRINRARFHPDYANQFLLKMHEENGEAPSNPVSLPNFETLLPPRTRTSIRYKVEMTAERLNDDNMTHYRFTKASVIGGLQAGLDYQDFIQLIQWLNFDSGNRQILTEWASCYQSSTFMDALILKMEDKQRFHELVAIPQFIELVREIIPDYGFILPRQNREPVREFLHQFGLFPGELEHKISAGPVTLQEGTEKAFSSSLPCGQVLYAFEDEENLFYGKGGGKGRYVSTSTAPSMVEKVRIIEYALITEKEVELSFMGTVPRRVLARPLHLIKDRGPVRIIATEITSGHRNEYDIEKATSLRVIE
ncbi:hypothetical protein ACFL5V_06795 [Fibrobacterota bacterium]